ncbi:hypothetical protein, partial [Nitrospira sp. BLG_2]|uniref:hypothetical protein n=1 Tax=Nitrospira sp. BLG_2 TaxID=3397507 RepID=UPI003B9D2C7A
FHTSLKFEDMALEEHPSRPSIELIFQARYAITYSLQEKNDGAVPITCFLKSHPLTLCRGAR